MNALLSATQTEFMKLRRTLALLMVLVAPLIVAGLAVVLALRHALPADPGTADALSFIVPPAFGLWSLLMLPLFIALETTLTASIEHNGQTWKLLFSLPVPRWTILLAKLIINLFIILAASLMLVLLIYAGGFVVSWVRPQLAFAAPGLVERTFSAATAVFLISAMIVAAHTWVSLRWTSVVVNLGFGIGAVVMSAIIANSEYWNLYPWAFPVIAQGRFWRDDATVATAWTANGQLLLISAALFLVLTGAMLFMLTRRDVSN